MSDNKIRLTNEEADMIASKLGMATSRHVIYNLIGDINDRRRERAREISSAIAKAIPQGAQTAGPFSAEQASISRVWAFRDQEVNRETDARVEALRLALQHGNELTGHHLDNAELFYKFLRGKS